MIAYIRTQGARIIKEGRHLLVKKGADTCNTLFTYKLDQVIVFGNVEITHQALTQLMRNNIDTVFLTQNGRYLGRIAPAEARNVFLRKKQYCLLDDTSFGLKVEKAIVSGKLANMATLLMRIKRSRTESALAGVKARSIQDLLKPLASADNIESVRGYEGRGTAFYFEALPKGFVEDWGFTRRVRRPPTDPVNSILSLLYTFLMNRVYAAVRVSALDPYPGFLHAIDYGRYSLVLDLMEEFRPIIVDTLTLSLFNLKILKHNDFYVEKPEETGFDEDSLPVPDVSKDPIGFISDTSNDTDAFDLPEQRMDNSRSEPAGSGKHPVKLRNDAFHRVIEAFEKKLTTKFYYPPAEETISFGEALIHQAGRFRKVIEGDAEVYLPLLLK